MRLCESVLEFSFGLQYDAVARAERRNSPNSDSTRIDSSNLVCSEIGNVGSLPKDSARSIWSNIPSLVRTNLVDGLYNESLYYGAEIL